MKNKGKRIGRWTVIGIVIVAIIASTVATKSMMKIGQGELGVVYTMANGVQQETLKPGYHFVHPLAKVSRYPVSQHQLVLSNNQADYNDNEHPDWSIDAPADGGTVKLNMTINYNFLPDRVVDLYTRFNGMNGEDIVDNMVQNSIVAYVKEVTPKFSVMDIYSTKRDKVSKAITEYLDNKLTEEYGIHISSALIIDVQLDDALMKKIKAKEQAKQDAEKAILDKKTKIAQGETRVAEAEADAKVKITQAEAEAQKKLIEADAEAKSNKKLSNSIDDKLIRMKEAEARVKHGWVTIQGASTVVTK